MLPATFALFREAKRSQIANKIRSAELISQTRMVAAFARCSQFHFFVLQIGELSQKDAAARLYRKTLKEYHKKHRNSMSPIDSALVYFNTPEQFMPEWQRLDYACEESTKMYVIVHACKRQKQFHGFLANIAHAQHPAHFQALYNGNGSPPDDERFYTGDAFAKSLTVRQAMTVKDFVPAAARPLPTAAPLMPAMHHASPMACYPPPTPHYQFQ